MAEEAQAVGDNLNERFDPQVNILLVDDNPANLLVLRSVLEDLGQNLLEARTGEEAIRHIQNAQFAVVLLDVQMPGTNGFETAKLIRAQNPSSHTPVIFLTAYDSDEFPIEEAYSLGAVDYLVKPFLPVVLKAKVAEFVELYQEKVRARREGDQLRLLIHGTTEYAIILLDPRGNIASWNLGAERITQYGAEEIIGRHFSRFYPKEAIDRGWPAHEIQMAQTIGRFEDEGWRVRKDGTQFWTNVVITALHDDVGNLRGYSKITRDMTEKKQAEENARRLIQEETARRAAEENTHAIHEQRERLQASERRKTSIIETSLDSIITIDHRGNVVEFNAAAERTFGYSREQVIGEPLADLIIPPALRESHHQGLAHYLATGEGPVLNKRIELPALRADGTEFPVELAITRIPADGPPIFTAFLRDITERHRIESQRNARLAVTQTLSQAATVDAASSGILQAVCENLGWDVGCFWILSPGDESLHCISSWHRAGVDVEEFETDSRGRTFERGEGLPGRVWTTRQPAWILDVVQDSNFPHRAAACQANLHGAFACPVVIGDKALGVIEFFSREIRETNADLLEFMDTIASQIGQFVERTHAEHALQRGEAQQRFLSEASAALVGSLHYQSILRQVADHCVPTLGDCCFFDVLTDDQRLERVGWKHVDPAKLDLSEKVRGFAPHKDAENHPVSRAIRTGNSEFVPQITDEWLQTIATSPEHLQFLRQLELSSLVTVPMVVGNRSLGALTFCFSVSRRHHSPDELRLAEELARRAALTVENSKLYDALRDTDRRKDEFLATLAHELRNPLAPIRNSLQILKMHGIDAETAQQTGEVMERQVHQLVRLVDDLLDVSRVMRGKIELRKEMVELASVVARAIETAQPLIEAQGHVLQLNLPQEPLLLEVDPVRLSQLIANLLANAAKYTEAEGRIQLIAERDDGEVVVTVRDDGIGIAPDVLPHVFELFVQAEHGTTRSQGGLGIGLTLVKNLAELHQGSVEARSAGLGQGSEFTVRLPLSPRMREEQHETVPDGHQQLASSSGHRLLVVDDNQDAATTLALLLRLHGHEVQVAHDGPSALELLKSYRPEMIFLDIGMPGMDGYEVARRLRRQPGLKSIVLAALTGWGQQEDRRRSAEAGFDYHLVKPPDPKALENVLAGLEKQAS